jgi:hypothetical protein
MPPPATTGAYPASRGMVEAAPAAGICACLHWHGCEESSVHAWESRPLRASPERAEEGLLQVRVERGRIRVPHRSGRIRGRL